MNRFESLGLESALILLALASLAAVQARAVRGAQRQTIQDLCRRRGRPERYDEILAASETIAFIAASVVVLAAVAATLLAFRGLIAAGGGSLAVEASAVAAWIAVAWLLLVVLPLLLVKLAGPWIVVATWTIWRPIVGAIAPVVGMLGRAAAILGRSFGRPHAEALENRPRDELRLVVDEAHREGRLEGVARDMIRGVIGLEEVRVANIMTPRTKTVSIPISTPWEEAVRLAAESGHTRLPVWDRSPDDVVGILHTRDVLTRLADTFAGRSGEAATAPAIRPLLRPPWFVPESMSVQKLLYEFQRGNTHMAIVTDEFGGVSGLVTIEDALEEIVGEIADEHDEAFTDGIRMLSATACEALAPVPIAAVNERLAAALPEEADFDTIGGFVFHQFGRIPEIGERIESHGVRLEVLAATRRRIDLVRVERLGESRGHDP
jgi:putative hemolysin